MRLSLIRVNWELQAFVVVPLLCSFALAGGFVLLSFVALPLVCPLPFTAWFMVGPCVQLSIPILH